MASPFSTSKFSLRLGAINAGDMIPKQTINHWVDVSRWGAPLKVWIRIDHMRNVQRQGELILKTRLSRQFDALQALQELGCFAPFVPVQEGNASAISG